jgi:hypothetical protein
MNDDLYQDRQMIDDLSHDDRVGAAYVAGMVAARHGVARNPYYHGTAEWVAYESGWRDEMARRS